MVIPLGALPVPRDGHLPVLCAHSKHPGFNPKPPKMYSTESKHLSKCCCVLGGGPDHKSEREESDEFLGRADTRVLPLSHLTCTETEYQHQCQSTFRGRYAEEPGAQSLQITSGYKHGSGTFMVFVVPTCVSHCMAQSLCSVWRW